MRDEIVAVSVGEATQAFEPNDATERDARRLGKLSARCSGAAHHRIGRGRHVGGEPHFLGGQLAAQRVVRIGDDQDGLDRVVEQRAGAFERLEGVGPRSSNTITDSGTPRSTGYCADVDASVNRSPS